MSTGILSGVRVLDFGRYISGPFCATLLADLGADVIRIDKIGGTEDRFLASPSEGIDGACFLTCNRNKRSITLDPTTEDGAKVLKSLIEKSDVVIANMPTSSLKSLNIDYDSLKKIKPDIILTSINAFGLTGPDCEKVGFEGIGQAMSGAMAISGYEGKPVKSQAPFVDFGTALSAAYGTLAAIIHKMKTGEGQHVHGSLIGTSLMMINPIIIQETVCNLPRVQTGNRHPYCGPTDLFQTKDGSIYIHVSGQLIFNRWVKMVNAEYLLQDERFKDDMSRGQHWEILIDIMSKWCADKSTNEAVEELKKAKVPAGPLLQPKDTINQHHFIEAGFFNKFSYPQIQNVVTTVDTPVKFSNHQNTFRFRPPLCGEHNNEILSELGYTQKDIEQLKTNNAI